MHVGGRSWLLAGLDDPVDTAPPGEAIRSRVRARQVYAIARLTSVAMPANILNALALVLVFAASGEPLWPVTLWAGAATLAAALFWYGWASRRHRRFPESLGPGTAVQAVRNAGLLGLLWAVPPALLMPGAGTFPQAFILLITAGMVSGGVTVFYPIPRAAAAYAAPQILGAIIGTAQASEAALLGGLIVTASYLLVVRHVIARHSAIFVSEIVARADLEAKTRDVEALLKQAEAETRRIARESARRLEHAQKMEAVGQLSGGMAHDFNNLLSVIRGNAEMQRESAVKDDGLIAEIIAAAEQGADLVQKLLAFARRQDLHPETVDAAALVSDAASVLERLLGERISVAVTFAADLRPVHADPAQLQAALVNLAINARDAMPDGGRLRLDLDNRCVSRTEATELAEILGHDVVDGEYVSIAVGDEGHGMDDETAARAFEPFFTTKPLGEGTGLGLSMVLGFIRQSGGFVTLETAPQAGTVITLHLLNAAAVQTVAEPASQHEPALGRGESVLLVEDQPMVRRTLARMLERLGYEVAEAGTVREAEGILASGYAADLVLSDVVLPGGMSGFDLAARLARRRGAPPLLLMSGEPGEDMLRKGDGPRILRKPVTRAALAQALRAALRDANRGRQIEDRPVEE